MKPIIGINGNGEYVYAEKPGINLFSNIFKLTHSYYTVEEWAELFGLDPDDIRFAVKQTEKYGMLNKLYQRWVEDYESEEEPW